jgi:hypothetical protein
MVSSFCPLYLLSSLLSNNINMFVILKNEGYYSQLKGTVLIEE